MSYSKYQQATIHHVCQVFSRQDAYLVADEVGLGKTYVAKGIIEKLHQGHSEKTMRVIYIASNQVIAKTNARDLGHLILKVTNENGKEVPYDRLSALGGKVTLPTVPSVQVYAFSPNTTFTGRGSPYGNREERKQLVNYAPPHCQAAVKLVSSYDTAGTVRTEETKAAVAALRKEFNDEAVAKLDPDLIILDEFHRFHTILSPVEQPGGYSFLRMIRKLNQARDKAGRPHVKVLLLSATPYKYNPAAEETVHTYETDEQPSGDKDPTTAFDDFLTLKKYICHLNCDSRGTPLVVGDTQQDYFDHILCRTQRNWLCPSRQEEIFQDITTLQKDGRLFPQAPQAAFGQHLAYSTEMRSRIPQTGQPELAHSDSKYKTLRAYLDEAPEYPQFADGYRSIQLPGNDTDVPLSVPKDVDRRDLIRQTYCQQLRENGHYLLRKNPADGTPDWHWFDKLHGHYKWELLKQQALPSGCEYNLWATPITLHSQNEYAKTVVFAHYRLSTRAIAALVSMEIERRLYKVNQGQLLAAIQPDDTLWDDLLAPFERYLHDITNYENALKSAILTFFNTTHARRVLTAFAITKGVSLSCPAKILRYYCQEYNWAQMILEYLTCLFKFELPAPDAPSPDIEKISEAMTELCSVLSWIDQDFTRVLVLPDWEDNGYPCSFGERYTADYSDKSAHDDSEKGKKQNTVRRLEYIRDRFQSPFYPFVLAASETAQEGVNLHNYCRTIVHWSVPSNLNSLVQEEGRVNRRGSWIQRKQMAYLLNHTKNPLLKLNWQKGWPAVFEAKTAAALCESNGLSLSPHQGGLFPLWYLPMPEGEDVPRLQRMLLCLPLSRESGEYETLFQAQHTYSTFGTRADDTLTGQLCPYLVYVPLPLFHGTNQYARALSDSRRSELYQAEDCVIPYIRTNEAALRHLRDQLNHADLNNAFLIWEALNRESANFEYHSLYLTFSRHKAEEYAASSYPCGERSFCICQLLLAIQQLSHPLPPADETQREAIQTLLDAFQESRTASKVILTFNMVPISKIQALENGNQDISQAIQLALNAPEYAQDSFRVDSSVFPTFSEVLILPV